MVLNSTHMNLAAANIVADNKIIYGAFHRAIEALPSAAIFADIVAGLHRKRSQHTCYKLPKSTFLNPIPAAHVPEAHLVLHIAPQVMPYGPNRQLLRHPLQSLGPSSRSLVFGTHTMHILGNVSRSFSTEICACFGPV